MSRNRGQFGTVDRAVTDHFKTLMRAEEILVIEHGSRHKPGDRADMCPKCRSEKKPATDGSRG